MKKLFIALCFMLTLQAQAQVEEIRVISIEEDSSRGYGTITANFKVLIPNPLGSSVQVRRILKKYKSGYVESGFYTITGVDTTHGNNRYANIIFTESFSLPKTKTQLRNGLIGRLNILTTRIATLVANLMPYDSMIGESYIDNVWQISPLIDSL